MSRFNDNNSQAQVSQISLLMITPTLLVKDHKCNSDPSPSLATAEKLIIYVTGDSLSYPQCLNLGKEISKGGVSFILKHDCLLLHSLFI